jgi:hypothetical protein
VAKKERTVRTTVLIPESLYETLKVIAEQERRSTHRQIIVALERYAAEETRHRNLPSDQTPGSESAPAASARTPRSLKDTTTVPSTTVRVPGMGTLTTDDHRRLGAARQTPRPDQD